MTQHEMNTDDYFQGNWINASLLPTGQDASMTIANVAEETLNDGSIKPVVYFLETEKGLILNKTNMKTIAGLHGKLMHKWPGKLISLFKEEVSFRGETMFGVRVRLEAPSQANMTLPEPVTPAPVPSL